VAEVATNRQIVEAFLDLINRERRIREAFEQYVSEDYIQHNPRVGNGRESAIELITELSATPGFSPVLKRIIAEDDLVVTHIHIQFDDKSADLAVMDMWRLHDGTIVEHWDVIQPVPAESASGNSMF
jgi:predicted SnoaL-like aldol condensation-catalyzing enzyme